MKVRIMSDNLKLITSPEYVRALRSQVGSHHYIAVDTETTGVDRDAEIVGMSIAYTDNKTLKDVAYYIVLAEWNKASQKLIRHEAVKKETDELVKILKEKHLIMHNMVFDCRIINDAFGTQLKNAVHHDTMIAAHLVDENGPKGLKDLGALILGEGATDEQQKMKQSVIDNGGVWELKKGGNKEMYKADPKLLGYYGAKDALMTLQLFYYMDVKLEEEGLTDFFYKDESMPLLRTATYDMNTVGLRVDVAKLKKLKEECEHTIASLKEEIEEELEGYRKYNPDISLRSPNTIAWLLFIHLGQMFRSLTDTGKKVAKDVIGRVPYSDKDKRGFINSIKHERERLEKQRDTDNLRLKPRLKEVEQELKQHKTLIRKIVKGGSEVTAEHNITLVALTSEKDSIKKRMTKLDSQIKGMRAEKYIQIDKTTLQDLAHKYIWIEKYLKLKKEEKILSTYMEGILEKTEYGVLQPRFNQTGTDSGRYSSSNPNCQNLPRDDKRIKSCFIPRPGKSFVGADQSQIEVRVFASISKDTALLDSFASGKDFYSVIGMRLFNKTDCTPYKEGEDSFAVKYKAERQTAKQVCLATAYGTTAFQQSTILKHSNGQRMTQDECQLIIDTYLEEFSGVKAMIEESHEMVKRLGYVKSLYGRIRRIPEGLVVGRMFKGFKHSQLASEHRSPLNLSMNFRVQSTAASIINRGAIRFYNLKEEMKRITGDKKWDDVFILFNVHDELIVECPDELVEDTKTILQNAMETAITLPGVSLQAIPTVAKSVAELK